MAAVIIIVVVMGLYECEAVRTVQAGNDRRQLIAWLGEIGQS
jgi:hypothetical protein